MVNKPLKSRVGSFKEHSFVLDYDYDPVLYMDDMKTIWCKTIEQAIHEYITYKYSRNESGRTLHFNARDFLFNNSYTIRFGDKDVTLRELLDMLDINIEWFRAGVRKKEAEANMNGKYKPGTQLSLF